MSPDLESERLRLAEISGWYSNRDWGFYTKLVHMGFRSLQPYFVTGSLLEVGCADGEMTRFLLDVFADLSVLDAAPGYVHAATALDPRIHGHVAMIEEWQPSGRYDNVLFAHVLEHVTAPVEILGKLAGLLTEAGRIFIIVPNALSLHRLAGVAMGMLERPTDLNEADISVGHRRVYTTDTLREDIRLAGLDIVAWGGIFLKPLANKQIEEQWSDELIEAYFQLGKNRPDLCSELFAVCRPETLTGTPFLGAHGDVGEQMVDVVETPESPIVQGSSEPRSTRRGRSRKEGAGHLTVAWAVPRR